MNKILISSFDMQVGGVERSLISMLNNFDYNNNEVDLILYSHTGDFMELLPSTPNLLPEIKKYKTFRQGIGKVIKEGNIGIGLGRLIAKKKGIKNQRKNKTNNEDYSQMQYMWKYTLPYLPKIEKKYDVAISYLWPHYFVAEKVNAKTKIAWIHTDYSNIRTDIELDLDMWNKFNYIVSISDSVTTSFLVKYPSLKDKIILIENITSPEFIQKMSEEELEEDVFKENFNLLSVARLSHAKGIDNGVRALKILHDRGYKDIKWYVIGYGGDEEMIKSLIKENQLEDSFIVLGKKINPYPYMKKCDIYVQPSRYEGKAVTVTEAQILGKPIVVTNYPTAKSQVKDGIDGYITEMGSEGIADGIEKLYLGKELREKLAENCRDTDYGNNEELEKLYNII
ncbi:MULTISPECIES: glycosyltransferase [Psychrilyobacter]|uniref:Glycosyltransferase n=1 Tax=Psychrilyobacter piezotolerans TaxID=2293438 RepID=A0ABX9KHQ9_9FUSO|nr:MULTISPECIES: glycosyltransferase [Psychrilyobacter]MCS5420922.1 glycosyltransferase [Psychrilyobacter sp. S5]NDI77674.1 glycosyltransferase [Psychrilyobacter piezotolerans]RDE62680.1 glycosyltransferase [Psychrilyobacter sp. S5]REI41610.1 glycosyltransferase [Psychrilyobacter piezotolerans]